MSERRQLVADLMAELTGRFEDLATLAASQHVSDHLDPAVLDAMMQDVHAASALIGAAQVLMEQPSVDQAFEQ